MGQLYAGRTMVGSICVGRDIHAVNRRGSYSADYLYFTISPSFVVLCSGTKTKILSEDRSDNLKKCLALAEFSGRCVNSCFGSLKVAIITNF